LFSFLIFLTKVPLLLRGIARNFSFLFFFTKVSLLLTGKKEHVWLTQHLPHTPLKRLVPPQADTLACKMACISCAHVLAGQNTAQHSMQAPNLYSLPRLELACWAIPTQGNACVSVFLCIPLTTNTAQQPKFPLLTHNAHKYSSITHNNP
jgi:hypothetical protein